jgi:hypothetical protein
VTWLCKSGATPSTRTRPSSYPLVAGLTQHRLFSQKVTLDFSIVFLVIAKKTKKKFHPNHLKKFSSGA